MRGESILRRAARATTLVGVIVAVIAGASGLSFLGGTHQRAGATSSAGVVSGQPDDVAQFAGHWVLVSGFADPTGFDVQPANGFDTLTLRPTAAEFDIEDDGTISSGSFFAGMTGANAAGTGEFKVELNTASGTVAADGRGSVSWEGSISSWCCGDEGAFGPSSPTSRTAFFWITGENMVVCRFQEMPSPTTCGGNHPQVVATFQREAVTEVEIVAFEGKVEFQRGGGAWAPLEGPVKLKKGDKIHTGFKATVKLVFPDGSIVDVKPMTLLVFEDLTEAKTRVFLPLGGVKATVTRLRGSHTDFEGKSPTTTASVRGTVFSMFVDPVALVTVVTVTKGAVEVAPNSGTSASVSAGQEVESTAAAVSAPAKPGTAGTPPGGISRTKATALVLKKIAKAEKPCGLVPRDTLVGLTPIAKGWDVAVTTTLGTSNWTVVKKKAKAADEAATDLKRRCR